jgi:hypothetical protein
MTTDYRDTFIAVAPDCPVDTAEEPPRGAAPTIAAMQYELLAARPYELTSDELLFTVHARRSGIAEDDADARARFLAADRACLRASPLGKRYGWGTHHDADGRVALVAVGSDEYARLSSDPALTQKAAMRSSRR